MTEEYTKIQLTGQEEVRTGKLARALFDIYGTSLAPDATFTLRIADGQIKGYDYNGTRAPWFTTFYGLYDRYHSNPGSTDWALPKRWQTPPAGSRPRARRIPASCWWRRR